MSYQRSCQQARGQRLALGFSVKGGEEGEKSRDNSLQELASKRNKGDHGELDRGASEKSWGASWNELGESRGENAGGQKARIQQGPTF